MDIRGPHSAECHCLLHYSQLYSTSFEITNWIDYSVTLIICSHTMSTNGSPPETTNMAPTSGLVGSQYCADGNVGASIHNAGNTPNKDTQFGQSANQFHPPPPGYSYPPSQAPFPGAPQFYHQAPFNMTASSQPSSGATQGYSSYGQSWPAYDFPQGGYGGPQKFPPQQFAQHGPSSPGPPRVLLAPPGNNPVIWLTSSAFTAPEKRPSAPGRPHITLPTKWFLPGAELCRTDVAGIAHLPPLPEISYNQYDADYEIDNSSDLGGAKGKAPISSNQTEFSLKQFATRMGQPNFSKFNRWKTVWVAGFLQNKQRSIIQGQNCLKQLRDGPLHSETAVADFLETFETWLPLENCDNAEWIWWQ